MTNQTENFSELMSDDSFEVVMRGYSRRQVHEYMTRTRNQIRDLEERLARTIEQAEQGRIELAEARRRLAEAPQDYDELGQRLSQILKLGEEEAAAKKESAEAEAKQVREQAKAQAESILAAAQEEAERRVKEATATAEQLLAQAGADAEERLNTAQAEAEETLRQARAEAERLVTEAKAEAERLVTEATAHAQDTVAQANAQAEATIRTANAQAESTLLGAQKRAAALDEHTGRRVAFLTDTHADVMRRLNEIGSLVTGALRQEHSYGPLVDEAAVLPPAPSIGPLPGRQDEGVGGEPAGQAGEPAAAAREAEDLPADGAPRPEEARQGDGHGPAEARFPSAEGDLPRPGAREQGEELSPARQG